MLGVLDRILVDVGYRAELESKSCEKCSLFYQNSTAFCTLDNYFNYKPLVSSLLIKFLHFRRAFCTYIFIIYVNLLQNAEVYEHGMKHREMLRMSERHRNTESMG